MDMNGHIDITAMIREAFDDQTDYQYGGIDPDEVVIDYDNVKMSHHGFIPEGEHNVTRNLTSTVPDAQGQMEVYFRAETDMCNSFRMNSENGQAIASLDIPEKFRLPVPDGSGRPSTNPATILVPHIGHGRCDMTANIANSRPNGTQVQFEELTVKAEVVVNTHFHGTMKIKRGTSRPEIMDINTVLGRLDLLEVNPKDESSKFFQSRGLVTIRVKREITE